jgi:lipopolysaccharide transport system ATP-binding protein
MLSIDIKNLSKRYWINHDHQDHSLKSTILSLFSPQFLSRKSKAPEAFWALKDINIRIKKGEVVGLVGHNGSGKSTLLKILSRITLPTEGTATINGRMASLLEVGTGFHPELTGRENVFLSGAIYGMRRSEVQKKYQNIVDFSGVEDFIDMPIKLYSSGMTVRLAFSLAVHLDADIILLDEVWAVGDQDFQKKSLQKIKDIIASGVTVITVSHSPELLMSFCTRCIKLDHGKLIADGLPEEVLGITESV